MKLKDINEWEKDNAILNKNGDVLCPSCLKELAKVTEWGMIRKCDKCKDIRNVSFSYAFNDANGRKTR